MIKIYAGILIVFFLILSIGSWWLMRFLSVERCYLRTVKRNRYIMHALGGVEKTYSYTNSVDALALSYQEGYRLFEVDVNYTLDGKLVLVHGWKKKDYNERIGMENCNQKILKKEKMYIPSYKNYMKFRIQGHFQASDFAGLLRFMKTHKDMYVMLDIGSKNYEETVKIYSDIVETAKKEDAEKVLKRLIVGGHTREMMDAVRSVYDFRLFNFYFAKDEKREAEVFTPEDFILYCKENHFQSFSIDSGVFTDEIAEKMKNSGLIIYVFAINDEEVAQQFLEKGATVIGTDFLRV